MIISNGLFILTILFSFWVGTLIGGWAKEIKMKKKLRAEEKQNGKDK